MDIDKALILAEKLSTLLSKIALLTGIIVPAITAIAKYVEIYFKGSFLNGRTTDHIRLTKEIIYNDEIGTKNLKNSLIFRELTNRITPIHTINLIMNCYDPAEAIYIYSKAPKYISFDGEDLKKPQFIQSKSYISLLIFLIASPVITFVLGTWGLLLTLSIFRTDVIRTIYVTNPFVLAILIVFILLFVVIIIFSWKFLRLSLEDIELVRKAVRFYKNYDDFREANPKNIIADEVTPN